MSQRNKLVRQTFELAKQFGKYTYPDHDIDWERVELVESPFYIIPPSALGRKLLDHEEALDGLARLTKETPGPLYIEFDPHLIPTIHDTHPNKSQSKEA